MAAFVLGPSTVHPQPAPAWPDLPTVPRWTVALSAPASGPPAASGPVVAVPLHDAGVVAHRMADGARAWALALQPTQPLAADDDRFYVLAAGVLHAVRPADGTIAWKIDAPGASQPPVARAGWVLVCGEAGVAALRASDGARMWTSEVGAVRHPPAVDGDLLYVAMADRRVLALDVTTGAVRWQRRLGGVPGEPFAVGGQLYVGAEDRFFYALEADSGEIAWRIRVGAAARGHAAADEDRVYFVGMDNVVYAFDRGDGALEWRRGITYRPSSGPALVGDAVIVPGPVVSLPAVGARRGTDAGTIPFGTKLATVPRVVALPGGLTHLAAITGDLDATWRLSLIGPELIPRLPVVPLTELPGVPIPVAPPGR